MKIKDNATIQNELMKNVKRYEHISKNDPNRQAKLKAQRDQAEKDAESGEMICLSDLFISHGM